VVDHDEQPFEALQSSNDLTTMSTLSCGRPVIGRRVDAMECLGVLTEASSTEGFCELGDACTALVLLREDYQAYRRAHPNRVGGAETGGEG